MKDRAEQLKEIEIKQEEIESEKNKIKKEIEDLEAEEDLKKTLKELEDQKIIREKEQEIKDSMTPEDRLKAQQELDRLEQINLEETLKEVANREIEYLKNQIISKEKQIRVINNRIEDLKNIKK
jgi:hypothetical protein